jgi:HSP20 family protein
MLIKYRPTDWFGLAPVENVYRDSLFAPFGALRREMDRLFSGFENSWNVPNRDQTPVQLDDRGDNLVLSVEVPGMNEKDIDLSITGDSVVLRGQRVVTPPQGYSCHLRERADYSFHRAYRLPVRINAEKADASLKNGILTVTLPKADEVKPRAIAVKST